MAKTLLLIVQSRNPDTYVNILTHCVKNERVENIFFIGREGLAEEIAELDELVRKICTRVRQLAEQHNVYISVSQTLPSDEKLRDKIERIDFLRPHLSLAGLRKKHSNADDIIVDITATSTQVSGNLMASFMTDGFDHICYFALHDKVYNPDWERSGKTKLYHDLVDDKGQAYYSYADFSKSDSVKYSFDKLRSRGRWVRILLLLSSLLVISVVMLLATQQTNVAQIAAVISAITILAGLLESFANLSKQVTGLLSTLRK
jgi:hypothetical protein